MNKPSIIPYILRKKAEHYTRTMARITGCDPLEESRGRQVVTARTFVSYRLLMEGFTEHAVGAILGNDHSTIHYYRKKAVAMLTAPGYDTERELWKSFNDAI